MKCWFRRSQHLEVFYGTPEAFFTTKRNVDLICPVYKLHEIALFPQMLSKNPLTLSYGNSEIQL